MNRTQVSAINLAHTKSLLEGAIKKITEAENSLLNDNEGWGAAADIATEAAIEIQCAGKLLPAPAKAKS